MKIALKLMSFSTAAFVTVAATAVAAGLPDILGIQLGMPLKEAHAKLQAALPKNKLEVKTTNLPSIEKPVIGSFSSTPQTTPATGDEDDAVSVFLTLPPNKQAVWQVQRWHHFPDNGIAIATLLASLREKYGKETVALAGAGIGAGMPTTDDGRVAILVWLFDEQGRPGAIPPNMQILNCDNRFNDPAVVKSALPPYAARDWCNTSYIAVVAKLSSTTPGLYDMMFISAINVPFALRAGEATGKWKNDIDEAAQKQIIEKGKTQVKPKL